MSAERAISNDPTQTLRRPSELLEPGSADPIINEVRAEAVRDVDDGIPNVLFTDNDNVVGTGRDKFAPFGFGSG